MLLVVGCSLSGMLYSLAIKPLVQKLRHDLSGVCLAASDVSFKLSVYADNVIVLANTPQCSVASVGLC